MNLLIVTPTLGTSPFLDQVVEQIQNLNCSVHHIMVCPGTRVEMLTNAYPNVQVVAEKEKSLYAAINQGTAQRNDWEWMTYINDDDLLSPEIDNLIEFLNLKTNPADIYFGKVHYIDENSTKIAHYPTTRYRTLFSGLFASGIAPVTQQGTLISRECFNELQGFDTSYKLSADFDFWIRAHVKGYSFKFFNKHLGSFRIRKGQLSADQSSMFAEINRSVASSAISIPPWKASLQVLCFRLQNIPAILFRFIKTGRLKSSSLFEK
tara:strand:+ start:747 stop:1538 length:792 start_codon:yes stop_codon:yes gene_type:complete